MRFIAEKVFPDQAASIRSVDIDFEKMAKSFMANQSRSEGIVNSPACTAKVAVSEATPTAFEATNTMPDEAMAANEVGNAGAMVCEPQESKMAVEAGFSLSDNQWEYLAWNKDVARLTSTRPRLPLIPDMHKAPTCTKPPLAVGPDTH